MKNWILVSLFIAITSANGISFAQAHRDKKVRDDRAAMAKDSDWYYDDLSKGIEAARKQSKPLMVVLRCIP